MAGANTSQPDNLVGSLETRQFRLPIGVGAVLVRGQVVAYDNNSKIVAYDSTGGATGANVLYGIVVEDANDTADDYVSVYVLGEFNITGLTFSYSGDSATQAVINAARDKGIILKTWST